MWLYINGETPPQNTTEHSVNDWAQHGFVYKAHKWAIWKNLNACHNEGHNSQQDQLRDN